MLMHSTSILQVIYSKKWHFAKKNKKYFCTRCSHTMFAADTPIHLFTSALAQKLAHAERKLHSSQVGHLDIA